MTSLYIALQQLLPQFLLGRLVHRLARVRTPWFKNAVIRGFCRLYRVDTTEADAEVPDGYASFNAFFTRRLRPGARPIDPEPGSIISPADGRVQQCGPVADGLLLQVKGVYYSVAELLGDTASAHDYANGWFLCVYLAPDNYHRVHAPLQGTLRRMTYMPGARLAVNEATAGAVPGLFARNERLVCSFETRGHPWSLVLVGALNVASISTAWAGEVLPIEPRQTRRWHYPGAAGVSLERGDELGHFNLGSTAILLLPEQPLQAEATLAPGAPLRVGERVARLL